MQLGPIWTYIRQASAPEEDDTARDGAFSYAAETHAAAVGAGVCYLATATGRPKLVGLLVSAVSAGLRGRAADRTAIYRDVVDEPHYALGGAVLGGVLGTLTEVLT